MGACTVSSAVFNGSSNDKRVCAATVTFSNSYATGGDSVSPNKVNLSQVDRLRVDANSTLTPSGYSVRLGGTPTAPTVKVYNTSGEIANATDLSTVVVPLIFVGS